MVKSKGPSKYFEREAQLRCHVAMCRRAKKKALDTIIGDYRRQFGQTRDYV